MATQEATSPDSDIEEFLAPCLPFSYKTLLSLSYKKIDQKMYLITYLTTTYHLPIYYLSDGSC